MERKTKIHAEEGKQDLTITREFDLPVELLFKAYSEAELFEQWMGTKLLKFEAAKYGSYEFETSDPQGNPIFRAGGVIHEFIPEQKIVRTFEMDNLLFGAQLEFLQFESLTGDTSKLTIQSIYKSVEARDQQLKLPFSYGLNMAHDKLQNILNQLK